MGYNTDVRGTIAIVPPIPWGQIADSPFLPLNARNRDDRDVMFVITEEAVETDDGTLVRRSATGIVSTWEDDCRAYNLIEHVQEVMDAHPDHEFVGRFDCEGAENGDLWRCEIVDRLAVKVKPRIVWPDGSETLVR
jgi:hypothetical protein